MFAAKLTWYITRSAGLTCWMLSGFAIVWGLFLSAKVIRRRGLPAWLLDLHTFLGTLSLVFAAIHLGALYFDTYAPFSVADLLIPFHTSWKPGAIAWGIVAWYLLLAVQLTSWARKRIPKRIWHRIHLLSFGLFITGTIHGITAGTDWTNRFTQAGTIAVTTLVVVLTLLRMRPMPMSAAPPRPPRTYSAPRERHVGTAVGDGSGRVDPERTDLRPGVS